MKITMEMVTKFNKVLRGLNCIFKLDLRSAASGENTQCEIVPLSNMFLKSSILNPTDEFFTMLEIFFSELGIKLHYNNTKTIFWSIDGWEE